MGIVTFFFLFAFFFALLGGFVFMLAFPVVMFAKGLYATAVISAFFLWPLFYVVFVLG